MNKTNKNVHIFIEEIIKLIELKNKWRDILFPWIGRLNILQMSISSKLVNRIFCVEFNKLIPKFMLESSIKKNKVRRFALPATKNYYRAIW